MRLISDIHGLEFVALKPPVSDTPEGRPALAGTDWSVVLREFDARRKA